MKSRSVKPKGSEPEQKPTKSYTEKVSLARHIREKRRLKLTPGSIDWNETAIARAERQAQLNLQNPDRRANKCVAMTTGVWGPSRLCENDRMHGLTVCRMHGGSIKATKAAAKRRFMEELEPSMNALREVRDQNVHYPSKLGAALKFIERAIGKQDVTPNEGAGAPNIIIGFNIGGLPQQSVTASVQTRKALPLPAEDDYPEDVEGEVIDEDDDDSDD